MPTIITDGAASAQGYGFAARTAAANYIEDVFSTYLYTGDSSSTRNISNGIDLAGKGGLTWIKTRTTPPDPPGGFVHFLFASDLGQSGSFYNYLSSNYTGSTNYGGSYPASTYGGLKTFNSDGFTVAKGSDSSYFCNYTGQNYVSWTFRKQAKFFDVVTYTGNGVTGRQISHALGSVPGFIVVKRTDAIRNWVCYHRALGNGSMMILNSTAAIDNASALWNNTTPTSTYFTVNNDLDVNGSGATYVAYLFAHDAGGFGASGSDNVISCGSFTANGSGQATISLSYEPQLILVKRTDAASSWFMIDNMRGFPVAGIDSKYLSPNTSTAENGTLNFNITNTGFYYDGAASSSWIYIAIRRGPMKTPTSGTSVFVPVAATGATGGVTMTTNFPADAVLDNKRNGTGEHYLFDRLRSAYGTNYLSTSSTAAEGSGATQYMIMDSNTTVINKDYATDSGNTVVSYIFRRAPGFFDVVCYTGTGSATTVSHNLGVAPELMIMKSRSRAGEGWPVYAAPVFVPGPGYTTGVLNDTVGFALNNALFNETRPTSSVFSVGVDSSINFNAATYVAYLFATVAGVSKVGSYTGTGTTKQIDCGFTGGARFVLIKRTDSTGDWYVWDSARGIVSGNDPYLLLNSTAAEVTNTDYIDTYSAGFEISSTAPAAINANGGTFIFLAIA